MNRQPVRIQLRRTKGWRMPASAVKVCRPGKWGNPYKVASELRCDGVFMPAITQQQAVDLHRENMKARCKSFPSVLEEMKWELGGFDLACWCRLCQGHAVGKPFGVQCDKCDPCHADTLGEMANG